MDVRIDVDGDDAAERRLTRLGRRAQDMSEPLGELGDQMLADVELQFVSEGGVSALGRRWKPLDPDYARWKAKHAPGRPILVLTGSLKRYMASRRAISVGPHRLTYSLPPRGHGLAKLEDRPVVPRVGRAEANVVFREWLREISRPDGR